MSLFLHSNCCNKLDGTKKVAQKLDKVIEERGDHEVKRTMVAINMICQKIQVSLVSQSQLSFEPKPSCELGRLHNPLAQKYCYVSWVLSFKAHYTAETKRRRHRPRIVVTLVCTHTYTIRSHMLIQQFNLAEICIISINPSMAPDMQAGSCAPLEADVTYSYLKFSKTDNVSMVN